LHQKPSLPPSQINNPPISAAALFFKLILLNLNKPLAAEARKAPKMTPKFKTDVESAKIDELRTTSIAPCQYPQLATSMPKNIAILDPHKANADVIPQGDPRVIKVDALRTAKAIAAAYDCQVPRKIRFHPLVLGRAVILGGFFFFSILIVNHVT